MGYKTSACMRKYWGEKGALSTFFNNKLYISVRASNYFVNIAYTHAYKKMQNKTLCPTVSRQHP